MGLSWWEKFVQIANNIREINKLLELDPIKLPSEVTGAAIRHIPTSPILTNRSKLSCKLQSFHHGPQLVHVIRQVAFLVFSC